MLGQSPLGVFQTLGERNLELFKQFQATMLNAAATPIEPKKPDAPKRNDGK